MIGIYKITSPTNRIYIGQSINLEERIRKYKRYGSKSQTRLQRSFNKYGTEYHLFEIIEQCDEKDLNERERYWQDYYEVTSNKGLNCRLTKSYEKTGKISETSRIKMLNNLKGKFTGEKNPFYGKKHSSESRMKMSNAQIGNTKSKGMVMEDRQRKHLSEIAKRRTFHVGYIILDKETGIFYTKRDLSSLLNMDRLKITKLLDSKNNERFIYV